MSKKQTAYKAIMQGIEFFRTRAMMSPVEILSDTNPEVFPILAGNGGSFINSIREASVYSAAAGFYGDGRFAAFSHEGNFGENVEEVERAKLQLNILSFLGDGFAKKKIGFTNGNAEWLTLDNFSPILKTTLEGEGVSFENTQGNLSAYDVIIFGNPWESLSSDKIDALVEFTKNGGGLLVLSLGWSWAGFKNDDECDNLPANMIGTKLGFKFTNGEAGGRYRISEDMPELTGDAKPLEIICADGRTDAEISALLGVDENTVYAVEGQYVISHFTNDLWKLVKRPKLMIDAMDMFYEKEYEFVGKIAHPYNNDANNGKLWYITNVRTEAFMYMSGDHCGMSVRGAEHFIKFLAGANGEWETAFPGWGFGHEVGHAMVNKVCGGLFQPDGTGESWNNVINMYAHQELGHNAVARNQGASYSSNFYGDDRKYAHLNGTDYDLLPDEDRIFDILLSTTAVFVKLPMLIVDYYGWEGMSKMFRTAAQDTLDGKTLKTNDEHIEYMIVTLSQAYNVDFSPIFEHWRFDVTEQVKSRLKDLPKETILTEIYNTTKNFDKYTVHINADLANN